MAGAVQDTVMNSAPVLVISIPCGALGAPSIRWPFQAALLTLTVMRGDGREAPWEFLATMKNLYLLPVLNPATVTLVEGAVTLMFWKGKRTEVKKMYQIWQQLEID